MTNQEIEEKIEELRNKSWSVWTETKALVNSLGHDDGIFFFHNIKSNAIQNVDDLKAIKDFLIKNL